jgi:hypothetical protein
MRPGDPKVVWEGDRVDQKTEITVDVDLPPGRYDAVLFFSEAWPFGDLKIGRLSQRYNRFQVRDP